VPINAIKIKGFPIKIAAVTTPAPEIPKVAKPTAAACFPVSSNSAKASLDSSCSCLFLMASRASSSL
jgi:hypothetical protein